MTIQLTRRTMHGIALVDLQGPLTADAAADSGSLRAAVAQLAEAGCLDIAVNLDEVTRLDACGLGELVAALHAARDRGARLTFVAPPPRVRRLLSVTQLDTVFDLCGSEAELRPRRAVAAAVQDLRRISCAIFTNSTRIFSSSA